MMKTLMVSAVALVVSISASASYECSQEEAQIRGYVVDVQPVENSKACTYRIEYTEFTSSAACPMNEEHAYLSRLTAESCLVNEGDEVSGYLVYKNGQLSLEGY